MLDTQKAGAEDYDSAAVEHRFEVREIGRVFPELAVREVRVLGGMLGTRPLSPFLLIPERA